MSESLGSRYTSEWHLDNSDIMKRIVLTPTTFFSSPLALRGGLGGNARRVLERWGSL
jgi:hypothetical protein